MENLFKIPNSYEKAYKPYVIDHMKYKRLGIMSDIHVPYHSVDALNIAFDHCHNSNTYRGTLCKMCNLALGYAKDNTEILKNMIIYLRNHKIVKGKVV